MDGPGDISLLKLPDVKPRTIYCDLHCPLHLLGNYQDVLCTYSACGSNKQIKPRRDGLGPTHIPIQASQCIYITSQNLCSSGPLRHVHAASLLSWLLECGHPASLFADRESAVIGWVSHCVLIDSGYWGLCFLVQHVPNNPTSLKSLSKHQPHCWHSQPLQDHSSSFYECATQVHLKYAQWAKDHINNLSQINYIHYWPFFMKTK